MEGERKTGEREGRGEKKLSVIGLSVFLGHGTVMNDGRTTGKGGGEKRKKRGRQPSRVFRRPESTGPRPSGNRKEEGGKGRKGKGRASIHASNLPLTIFYSTARQGPPLREKGEEGNAPLLFHRGRGPQARVKKRGERERIRFSPQSSLCLAVIARAARLKKGGGREKEKKRRSLSFFFLI